VYVSLNCGFTYSNAAITLSNIPDGYKPKYKVYALCPITNRGIARLSVNSDGSVGIDWVQDSTSGAATTSFTTGWIDGYIDYWI
jgi:hypothetical protein